MAKDFYDYLKYDKSKRTAYNYSLNVHKFLTFVKKPLDSITSTDITRWYDSLKKEGQIDRSISRYGHALRSFFYLMNKSELAKRTPIQKEFYVKEPVWLNEKETLELIDENILFAIGYELALRVGEIPLLKRGTLSLQEGKIEVIRLKHAGRQNKYMLPIRQSCLEILESYVETLPKRDDELFPFSVSSIQYQFRKRAREFDLPKEYTFHCLRHSRITHMAVAELENKGVVDEIGLAHFAGHLRVETTRSYVHLAMKHIMQVGRR